MNTKNEFNKPSIVKEALSTETVFCRSLVSEGYLTEQQMLQAARRYRLGRSKDGGVIFWEIDEQQKVRDGKIMFYHDDCHRDHDHNPDWVSSRLKAHYGYDGDLPVDRCLFGLHLIGAAGGTVCVVEAEKTAVICSELFPQAIWLASGGLSMLNAAKLYPLRDYKLVLFPDTDSDGKAFQFWRSIAITAQEHFKHPIRISSLLETHASPSQKSRKIDLIDFIFEPQID